MHNLVKFLSERNLTISSAESFTGGLFASEITKVQGASKVFKGSVISYDTSIKINILGIDTHLIDKYSVISNQCAENMALNIASIMKSDIGVSFTGVAGPNKQEDKPVGTVYIGISYNNKVQVFTPNCDNLTRQNIREFCVKYAKDKIMLL